MITNALLIKTVFLIIGTIWMIPMVYAESCDPTTSDDIEYILDGKACVFDGELDGVDAGEEEDLKNKATLVLKNNTTLTIPNNQSLAFGSILIETGSIIIRPSNKKGSVLYVGNPLYYMDIIDEDNDAVPASGGDVSLVKKAEQNERKKINLIRVSTTAMIQIKIFTKFWTWGQMQIMTGLLLNPRL